MISPPRKMCGIQTILLGHGCVSIYIHSSIYLHLYLPPEASNQIRWSWTPRAARQSTGSIRTGEGWVQNAWTLVKFGGAMAATVVGFLVDFWWWISSTLWEKHRHKKGFKTVWNHWMERCTLFLTNPDAFSSLGCNFEAWKTDHVDGDGADGVILRCFGEPSCSSRRGVC